MLWCVTFRTNITYSLRSQTDFASAKDKTSSFGLNSLISVTTTLWGIDSYDIKLAESLKIIKKNRKWEPQGCFLGFVKFMFAAYYFLGLNIYIINRFVFILFLRCKQSNFLLWLCKTLFLLIKVLTIINNNNDLSLCQSVMAFVPFVKWNSS